MSEETIYAFEDPRDFEDILEILRWWRTRPRNDQGADTPRSPIQKPDLVVCLLDTLNSGQSVKATVLEPRKAVNEVQIVSALGQPQGGYLRFGFQPSSTATVEYTPNVYPLVDGAEVVQRYMGALPSLSMNDVTVGMGRRYTGERPNVVGHNPWRWQFEFRGRYEGRDMQPLVIDSHLTGGYCIVQSDTTWVDTYRIVDVFEVLGVPDTSPLVAGARAWVRWRENFGYCLIACEPRDFGDYQLFT